MEKINKLKKFINDYNLDGYIIPKNDEFFNEFIPEEIDRLKFISNFSGSYGFALILKNKNFLFVDGRYTLQAKIQSGKLFKIITIPKQLPSHLFKKTKLKIGFDPKLHTNRWLNIIFKRKNLKLVPIYVNLIDKLKKREKNKKQKKFYILPNNVVGKSYQNKINLLSNILKKKKINFQFISANENLAWLLNIRGQDSKFTPIPNAHLIIIDKKIYFFCDAKKIDQKFRNNFKNINFLDIKYLEFFLSKIKNKRVLIDSSTCSVFYETIINTNNKIVQKVDPIYYLKSVKSKKEIKNIKKSHIIDGAALTKFLFWVKKNYIEKNINELNAQKKLLNLRKKDKSFKFQSFPTISGSGPNGAIIHYKASKKSNRRLKSGDIYLVDSGGQYNFGTTDVTRTISLNNNDKNIKEIFTRVLKGHIAVSNYKLKNKTIGSEIDIVARQSLKKIGLDYAHGTGHGVGYFLNVHEGPQAFSKNNKVNLKEGMVISNEPGCYKVGKFGIRIENLIWVKKKKKGYVFDDLTMAPIDKTLIKKEILKPEEINWLNNYHKKVFNNLKRFMNKTELYDLKHACSSI